MKNLPAWIKRQRQQKRMNQQQLADWLNINLQPSKPLTKQVISHWETGYTQPDYEQVLYMGILFGVHDPYAVFINECKYELNQAGQEQLNAYITDMARLLEESGRYSPTANETAIRMLPLYDLPVSAGTGQFIDGQSHTMVEVDSSVPRSADFGVTIRGDSMEPRFVDGQTVWVQAQNTIEHGEIGIFFYDDNAYIKKFEIRDSQAVLVSQNKKYEPKVINSGLEFRVYGKVVG